MKPQLVSLPDDPGDLGNRSQPLVDFWNALRISGDSGATTWEELEKLEHEVTDCLAGQMPDVERAESLTARAMLLIAGCSDS
jgi:hypothetical protein